MSSVPDSAGEWKLIRHDGEITIFETYELPTGHLVAWCDDVGLSGGIDQSIVWHDDEWVGHIPVECMSDWGTFERVE